jgi:membrane associated rhomboid family serine protease
MGIGDRDYMRPANAPYGSGGTARSSMGQTGLGQLSGWSVTTWLLVINIAVFLIDGLLQPTGLAYIRAFVAVEGGLLHAYLPLAQAAALQQMGRLDFIERVGPLNRWGYFSFETALAQFQVWRWISFQFLHAGLWHILGNMIGLYFFGSLIERFLGRRRFLVFYLACGVAGPVLYLLIVAAGVLDTQAWTPLVGASAGVFGVLAAAAVIAPNATVLVYGVLPVKLRTLAIILLCVAAYTVFTSGNNAGGEAAHLGGAALGYLLIRNPHWLSWAERGPKVPIKRPPQRPDYMKYQGWR